MSLRLLTVPNTRYCIKMYLAGFGPNVTKWFRSYLDRSQQVIVNRELSDIVSVDTGMVLGPILFIFCINDIFKCAKYA